MLWPMLAAADWPLTNQGYRYPLLLELFARQFRAGYWYPRWLPTLWGGYGYPTFVFYPPGFWFLSLPWTFAGFSAAAACKITLLLALTAGGAGAWKLACRFCPPGPALIVMPLFYLTPYIPVQLYFRGSFAELSAMMVCPWVFAFFIRLFQDVQAGGRAEKAARRLAFCMAALMLVHAMIALWVAACLLGCGLALALTVRHPARWLLLTGGAALLAAALASPYWLPALLHKHDVSYKGGFNIDYRYVASWAGLWAQQDKHGSALALPVVAALGFLAARRKPPALCLLGCMLALLLYTTPLSAYARAALPALDYLQGPLRTLSVLASLQVAGAALLLTRPPARPPLLALALLLLAWNAPQYSLRGVSDLDALRQAQRESFDDLTHTHEFRPVKGDMRGLRPRLDLLALPPGAQAEAVSPSHGSDITATVKMQGRGDVIVNQLDFPGWRITVNGEAPLPCPPGDLYVDMPVACAGPNGRIRVILPYAGEYTLHARYAGPPHAGMRLGFGLFAGLLGLAAIRLSRRLSRSGDTPAG